jgi:hypothetical protein
MWLKTNKNLSNVCIEHINVGIDKYPDLLSWDYHEKLMDTQFKSHLFWIFNGTVKGSREKTTLSAF